MAGEGTTVIRPTPPATPKRGYTSGKMIAAKVQMLDDTLTIFQVQPKALGRVLFEQLCRQLNLLEADYFGLEYQDAGGSRYWLDLEKHMNRQLGLPTDPVFRFGVKFYTPDPGQLEEEFTRYLFCLQIKRDLAQGILRVNDNTAAVLASYIVQGKCLFFHCKLHYQAESGDYVAEDYPDHSYLSGYKFVPDQTPELERRIMENHKKLVWVSVTDSADMGQSPAEADLNLLETARRCEFYGIKMTPSRDQEGIPLNLAITHTGLHIFQNWTRINMFNWGKIRKLSFKRKRFLLKLHPDTQVGPVWFIQLFSLFILIILTGLYKNMVEFHFDGRNESKNFWKKCVEHHGFFRCTASKKSHRQKPRVISRGSSFRYSGRTQVEVMEFVRENYIKRQSFQRSQSFRQSTGPRHGHHMTAGSVGTSLSAQPLLPISTEALLAMEMMEILGTSTPKGLGRLSGGVGGENHIDAGDYDMETPSLATSRAETLSQQTSVTSSPQRMTDRITDDECSSSPRRSHPGSSVPPGDESDSLFSGVPTRKPRTGIPSSIPPIPSPISLPRALLHQASTSTPSPSTSLSSSPTSVNSRIENPTVIERPINLLPRSQSDSEIYKAQPEEADLQNPFPVYQDDCMSPEDTLHNMEDNLSHDSYELLGRSSNFENLFSPLQLRASAPSIYYDFGEIKKPETSSSSSDDDGGRGTKSDSSTLPSHYRIHHHHHHLIQSPIHTEVDVLEDMAVPYILHRRLVLSKSAECTVPVSPTTKKPPIRRQKSLVADPYDESGVIGMHRGYISSSESEPDEKPSPIRTTSLVLSKTDLPRPDSFSYRDDTIVMMDKDDDKDDEADDSSSREESTPVPPTSYEPIDTVLDDPSEPEFPEAPTEEELNGLSLFPLRTLSRISEHLSEQEDSDVEGRRGARRELSFPLPPPPPPPEQTGEISSPSELESPPPLPPHISASTSIEASESFPSPPSSAFPESSLTEVTNIAVGGFLPSLSSSSSEETVHDSEGSPMEALEELGELGDLEPPPLPLRTSSLTRKKDQGGEDVEPKTMGAEASGEPQPEPPGSPVHTRHKVEMSLKVNDGRFLPAHFGTEVMEIIDLDAMVDPDD
ncbi:unnamed protein product, partial [Darwinula stevensoni]